MRAEESKKTADFPEIKAQNPYYTLLSLFVRIIFTPISV